MYESHRRGLSVEEEYGAEKAAVLRRRLSDSTRVWAEEHSDEVHEIARRRGATIRLRGSLSGSKNGMFGRKGRKNPSFGKVVQGGHTRGRGGFRADIGHYVRSSWEANYCRWLRFHGITYEYEPRAFDMGDSTYIPDFWITSWNCWVEIKGYWTEKARLKVSKFRQLYPGERLLIIGEDEYKELEEVPGWERGKKR
jgi:hypothetical protein